MLLEIVLSELAIFVAVSSRFAIKTALVNRESTKRKSFDAVFEYIVNLDGSFWILSCMY